MLEEFGEVSSVCSANDDTIRNCIGDYNTSCDCTCGSPEGQGPDFSVMGVRNRPLRLARLPSSVISWLDVEAAA